MIRENISNHTGKIRIKKDDIVQILAGKDKGKKGKVIKVIPFKDSVIVEKLNIYKRHTKANQKNMEGGIIEKEGMIHISNVMPVCSKCDKAVRVARKTLDDNKKVRICKKCGEVIE